jgi:transaldolase
MSVKEGMRINITLVFSQEQAAAVYSATKGATPGTVYLSPFIGRLDDKGEDGMSLIRNIKAMYAQGDSHVWVLAASIRNLEHLLYSFSLGVELATVPTKVLEEWASKNFPMPDSSYTYNPVQPLNLIVSKELDLNSDWQSFNIQHELTDAGILKFVSDYKATINQV